MLSETKKEYNDISQRMISKKVNKIIKQNVCLRQTYIDRRAGVMSEPNPPCLQRRFGEFCATRAARRRLDSLSRHRGAESRYHHPDNRATYFSELTRMYESPSAHGGKSARITPISFVTQTKEIGKPGKGRGTPLEIIA